jgi:RNA polymerase sigma-70 factor (ECF subfamily)
VTEIEKLYSVYFQDVYLFVLKLSGDKHLAEEITSDAFFKAMNSIDRFRGTCEIRVWLCQIAKNCYYTYLRKSKQKDVVPNLEEIPDTFILEQSIIDREASMKIHKALHNLKEPYKEVFTLRIFGELSFKQIASLFGKTPNWACVTYHRARSKIIEEMED